MATFSYAGMPYDEVEQSMHCFVQYVLPELKKWDTPPLVEPMSLSMLKRDNSVVPLRSSMRCGRREHDAKRFRSLMKERSEALW